MFYEIVLATIVILFLSFLTRQTLDIFDLNTFRLKMSLTKMFKCFCIKKTPLICAKCKKVLKKDYKTHVTCHECKNKNYICKEHLLLCETEIQCKKCKSTFLSPPPSSTHPIEVKPIENRVIQLNNETKTLPKNLITDQILLETYLSEMVKCANELETKLNELGLKVYEYFFNLKSDIDINRETLIQDVYASRAADTVAVNYLNDESARMITKCEQVEEEFLQKLTSLKLNKSLDTSLELERKMYEDFFCTNSSLAMSELDLASLKRKFQSRLTHLQSQCMIYSMIETLLYKNTYEPSMTPVMGTLNLFSLDCLPPERPIQNVLIFNVDDKDGGLVKILNLNSNHSFIFLNRQQQEEHFQSQSGRQRVKCFEVYDDETKLLTLTSDSIKMWDMLAKIFLKEFLKPSSLANGGEYLCMKILKNNRLAAGSSDKSVHGKYMRQY
jgi:hypothetical protein